MSNTRKSYRFSLALDAQIGTQLDEVVRLSGKTRNALVEELVAHSLSVAYEHYKELRILELRRLEKERNTPFKEIE